MAELKGMAKGLAAPQKVEFPDGSDADMYAKTGIRGYGVTDETVKMVEDLRGKGKLSSKYPDNYDYYKQQGWNGPWYWETSNFSSKDGDSTRRALQDQYSRYGTGEFITSGPNGEEISNKIVRVPKGSGTTPRSPAKKQAQIKSTIRRWKSTGKASSITSQKGGVPALNSKGVVERFKSFFL